MAKDPVVPLGRPAPGEGKRQEGVSGQERPWQYHGAAHPAAPSPPRRAPLPEVSPADVGHPGAAHGTGLDEVLGRQHDGLDPSLHRHLVVLHREGAEQAGSPRQVRAPAPATERESPCAPHGVPSRIGHRGSPHSPGEGDGGDGMHQTEPRPRAGPGRPHRSTMQSLRGCGAMLSVT